MPHEIRNRIVRPATPEETERHKEIREQVEQELPELTKWAKEAAARHRDRIAVGTVFDAAESNVISAIDDYAAKHSLAGRGAVVREALAKLLGVEIQPTPRSQ
ncbi:MAG TPA: hypothetical protein VGM05_26135 [Planctomycetaceae bacterium]|jgi:hypothetical protein